MGLMDSIKAFVHSVTTEDHYALYGSLYENSSAGGSLASQPNSSSLRLQEHNNSLSHSLMGSRNDSSSNIVGYRPGMRSSSTNVGSAGSGSAGHEMQTFGADGHPPLPSIDNLWERIEAFLEEEYPELEDSLNNGASSADLNEFEKDLAAGPLPVEVRQFYKKHDGQFRGGKPTGLIMGLTLLDIESIMEEYYIWAKVAEKVEKQRLSLQHHKQRLASIEGTSDAQISHQRISNSYLMHQKSIPPHAVQPYYVHRGWVPIARDFIGNVVALDLAPGPAGIRGQIILYGREFDTKVVVASSLQELLFNYVTDLETGNFQIDKNESNNDNGFLDTSRDDDYMIGDEDEDNGELAFFDCDGAEFGKHSKNKLSYIDVLKRRALARFGITRNENFQTAFTPQRIPKKHPQQNNAPAPKLQSSSRSKTGSSSQLLNVESATDLLKETLIGAESKEEDKKESVLKKAVPARKATAGDSSRPEPTVETLSKESKAAKDSSADRLIEQSEDHSSETDPLTRKEAVDGNDSETEIAL